MDLDITFRDYAALRRPTVDRDAELVHPVTRLAVVLHVDSKGAGRAILRASAGERRTVAADAQAGDRNAVHVHVTGMVLILQLSARAAVSLCDEPEVREAARHVDFSAAGHFPG